MTELFDVRALRCPLDAVQRDSLLRSVVLAAKFGQKWFYTLKETAGLLHWSYDQVFDAVHFFRIDAARFLGIIRVPWWSLAEYLLDPADDVDAAVGEYLDTLPHREDSVRAFR